MRFTPVAEYETPKPLFDRLSAIFGPFTLDPCCTNLNHKCERFYTKLQDGLKQNWGGERVFMHPPSGPATHSLAEWMEKLCGYTGIALVPLRTDTAWWHECVEPLATCIMTIRGRIYFVGQRWRSPMPHCVVSYGIQPRGNPLGLWKRWNPGQEAHDRLER